MLQPVHVLPSNAPPLEDSKGRSHRHSRVPLENPSNWQYNDASHLLGSSQKLAQASNEDDVADETVPVSHHRDTGHSRPAWNYSRNRGRFDDRNSRDIVAYLYHRLQSSDAYSKYRKRQRSSKPGRTEQKWPDDLELAFCEALVRWPPMGKRKYHHKGKLRGHNELISDHIEEVTGQRRDRKQISSHIQVLKPFIGNDPFVMKWLSKDDLSGPGTRFHGGAMRAPPFPSGKRLSTYTGPSSSAPSRQQPYALPDLDRRLPSHLWTDPSIFHPISFEMFVQRKLPDRDEAQRLHIYTSSFPSSHSQSGFILSPTDPFPLQIPSWSDLNVEFPLLAAICRQHSQNRPHHPHQQQPFRPPECPIYLATASLALSRTQAWRDAAGNALPDVELGISFVCASAHLPPRTHVLCRNSFYRNGRYIAEEGHGNGHGNGGGRVFEVIMLERGQQGEGGFKEEGYDDAGDGELVGERTGERWAERGTETQLKFGSGFWARTLAYLAAKGGDSDDAEGGRGGSGAVSTSASAATPFSSTSSSQPGPVSHQPGSSATPILPSTSTPTPVPDLPSSSAPFPHTTTTQTSSSNPTLPSNLTSSSKASSSSDPSTSTSTLPTPTPSITPPFATAVSSQSYSHSDLHSKYAHPTQPDPTGAAHHLSAITVCQEVLVPIPTGPRSGGGGGTHHRRLAIILWRFSLAPSGEEGTTEWRRVTPPGNHGVSTSSRERMDLETGIGTGLGGVTGASGLGLGQEFGEGGVTAGFSGAMGTLSSSTSSSAPSSFSSSAAYPAAYSSAEHEGSVRALASFPRHGLRSPFRYAAPPSLPGTENGGEGWGVGGLSMGGAGLGLGANAIDLGIQHAAVPPTGFFSRRVGDGLEAAVAGLDHADLPLAYDPQLSLVDPGLHSSRLGGEMEVGGGEPYGVTCDDSLNLHLDFDPGLGFDRFGDLGFPAGDPSSWAGGLRNGNHGAHGLGLMGMNGDMEWELCGPENSAHQSAHHAFPALLEGQVDPGQACGHGRDHRVVQDMSPNGLGNGDGATVAKAEPCDDDDVDGVGYAEDAHGEENYWYEGPGNDRFGMMTAAMTAPQGAGGHDSQRLSQTSFALQKKLRQQAEMQKLMQQLQTLERDGVETLDNEDGSRMERQAYEGAGQDGLRRGEASASA